MFKSMIWYCSSAYVEYMAEYMVNLVEVLPPANCISFARQVCRPTGYIRTARVEVGRQVIRYPTLPLDKFKYIFSSLVLLSTCQVVFRVVSEHSKTSRTTPTKLVQG